jgi:hypothetical protein
VGFNYVHIRRGVPETGNQLPSAELRIPGVPDDPRVNGLTLFAPSGFRRLGDPSFAPTIVASQERQITDVLTLVRGAHTLKLGGEIRWSQFNISQESAPRGRFSFDGQFTRNPVDGSGAVPLPTCSWVFPSAPTFLQLSRWETASTYHRCSFKTIGR